MVKLTFVININLNIEVIMVIISFIFFLLQKKKKGDSLSKNFKVGNIQRNPTIKLLNFNINSKNKNNIKNY